MLNIVWLGFFVIAFISALIQLVIHNNFDAFSTIINSTFEMSKFATTMSIGLIGILAMWLGFFKIAEKAGIIDFISKILSPLFKKLMPDIPDNHPVIGTIVFNISANILGLDNAATPSGIKAMNQLQELNPNKKIASNSQILLVLLNSSSLMLIPITIFIFRAQLGASDPTEVFIPILLSTSASTLTAFLSIVLIQRLNIFNIVTLFYFMLITVILVILIWLFMSLPIMLRSAYSSMFANIILFSIITSFLVLGFWKKVDIFNVFIDGAKEGFDIAIKLIPYLVAMLVGIGVFRASGIFDTMVHFIENIALSFNLDTEFVKALPTAFMKPFSGSGARAMMVEAMNTYGVDSFPARLSAIMQGSTETTFYIIAVYFGSTGIRNFRYTIPCALLADLVGIVTAIIVCYQFFG